jgi:hypothetical protein
MYGYGGGAMLMLIMSVSDVTHIQTDRTSGGSDTVVIFKNTETMG